MRSSRNHRCGGGDGPLKKGKEALAERYRRALTDSASWSVRTLDAELAMLAARMGLPTSSSFQKRCSSQRQLVTVVTHS